MQIRQRGACHRRGGGRVDRGEGGEGRVGRVGEGEGVSWLQRSIPSAREKVISDV